MKILHGGLISLIFTLFIAYNQFSLYFKILLELEKGIWQ